MVYLVLCSATLFSALYVRATLQAALPAHLPPVGAALLAFKVLVEVGSSYYGIGFLMASLAYLCAGQTTTAPRRPTEPPPVGIVYLCCDDLNPSAFASLAQLRYPGKRYLIVHDDSTSQANRAAVDAVVEQGRGWKGWEVVLLRRPRREGGKPGAANHALQRTGHLYQYVLLCDNDSTVLDPRAIEAALSYFEDPTVAVVQCRNSAVPEAQGCRVNRWLARSIDAFHVFLSTCSRFGWQPFVGHNAVLRTAAVRQTGGFTPGFFSDDLDLTVRLNLQGHRVAYASEIRFGETHPASYDAFRRRSYKWAYGCIQTLRAHTWSVLTSKRLSLAEKWSFFQFTGFYVAQTVLLVYLGATCLVAPFLLQGIAVAPTAAAAAGTVIILCIFGPLLAFFAKESDRRGWPGTVLACGLVYGATDFACAAGVWDCVRNRKRSWTPTNLRAQKEHTWPLLAEAVFGALLLCVPLLGKGSVLYFPCFYLFGGKFLFAPAIALFYRDPQQPVVPSPRTRSLKATQVATLACSIVVAVAVFQSRAHTATRPGVEIRGKELYVDGRPFAVKGVHYGPWRPGTGPGKGYRRLPRTSR
jgi:GT2 family glycosyltransferase